MTAGIFAAHGVWTGDCFGPHKINKKGFFENRRMKTWFSLHGNNTAGFVQYVLEILSLEGHRGGPCLFKCGWERIPMWEEFDPKFIYCRRPYKQVAASRLDAGFSDMGQQAFEKAQRTMDESLERNGGVDVFPDQFTDGDFSSIINALEYCGIKPDIKKIKDFYEPDFWNQRT